jgi:hypothetical protein
LQTVSISGCMFVGRTRRWFDCAVEYWGLWSSL